MIEGLVAKRYAEALFEVANNKKSLDQIEEDLQLIVDVFENTSELTAFLHHPKIDDKTKKAIIDQAFDGKLNEMTKNLLYLLIDNNRTEYIGDIKKEFVKLANIARNIVDVEAITAIELDKDSQDKVSKTLKDKLGKSVRLKSFVDPSLLGGIVIKIGDRVYDGSINKQLKVLKRSLKASRV